MVVEGKFKVLSGRSTKRARRIALCSKCEAIETEIAKIVNGNS